MNSYQNSFFGSLTADAVSMPVHWYYDMSALDRDYPDLAIFTAPKNPHPDSILWRSSYTPRNSKADILHSQARYWGKRGIHYHQFLSDGENTLNFRLAIELYRMILEDGSYEPNAWLEVYKDRMLSPDWHSDTYVEEYHRAFFDRLASGVDPTECGIDDIHIGGLATVPALLAGLSLVEPADAERWSYLARQHVSLTHQNRHTLDAASALVRILVALADGSSLEETLENSAGSWFSLSKFKEWSEFEDRIVVGRVLSTACYLPASFTASLYLVWKYDRNFEVGVLANALCGGDNCHRGAVVGSILGILNPISRSLIKGLRSARSLIEQQEVTTD